MNTQSDHQHLTVFNDLTECTAAEGAGLGPTDWLVIDQARVDEFAQVTDDHQWKHVDPDRATVEVADGVQATLTTTIEVDGSDKPAAVVESIARYLT